MLREAYRLLGFSLKLPLRYPFSKGGRKENLREPLRENHRETLSVSLRFSLGAAICLPFNQNEVAQLLKWAVQESNPDSRIP